MPLRKHDSTVVLEVISAIGLVALFSIAGMLYIVHTDLQKANQAPAAIAAEDSSKKVTLNDLSPELQQDLTNAFGSLSGNMGQVSFLMKKILNKNFTPDEIQAFQDEYEKSQTPPSSPPAADGTPPSASIPARN